MLDVWVLADKYVLPELRNKCESFLEENITENNFVPIFKYADQLGCDNLLQAVSGFVKVNYDICKERADFIELPSFIFDELNK